MAFLYPTAVRCDYVHKQCLRESDFTSSLVLRVQQSPQRRSRRSSVVLSAHLSRRVFLSYALSAAFAPLLRTPARAEYNIEPQALDKVPELESSALGNGTAFGFRLPIDQAEQSRSIRQPSEEPDPRVRMQVFERRPRGSRAHKFKTGDESDDDSSSPSGPLVPGTVRLRVGKGIDRLDHRGKENERRAYEDLQAYESVEGLTEYDEDARVPVDYDDAITIRPDENYGDSFVGFLHTSAITAGAVLAVASLIALAERTSTSRRDAIPLEYNRKRIARYCLMRPERVIMRVSKYALEIMRYTSIVAWHAFLDGIRAGGRAAKRARRKRRARNLREGITRLGPGLIKLGQAAATRPDLFGETFTSELQLLQDSLFQGFESTEAFDLIRDELDAPLRSVFAYIEPKPVAGASLGMVFKAWLVEKRKEESHVELAAKNQDLPSAKSQEDNLSLASVSAAAESSATTEQKFGDHAAYMPRTWVQSDRDQILRWRWERPSESYLSTRQQVAIKVQRPHVAELMTLDFFIVRGIASFAARILNIRTDLGGAVDEYASSTFEELNYTKEASNMQRFREMYGTTPGVYIPEVYPLYSSRRVLVSEWIDGIKLTDKRARVRAQDIGIVETGIRSALDQCLSGGFMHCDLHNGNILRLKQDLSKLAFIDFGICASIPEYTRQCTVCALLHLIHHDYEALADTFAGMSLMRAVDLEKELPLLSTALGRALEPNGGNNGDGGDIEESRQSSVSENSPTSSRQPMGSSSKKTLLTEELTVQQMAPLFTQTNVRDKSDEDRVKCADTVDSTAISPEEERAFDVYEKLPTVSKFTFIGVADKLIRLSGQFPLVFRDYFLSNIKSLAMLEGLAMNADPSFNVLTIVYPYVVSKVLSDPAKQFRAALHDLVVDNGGRVRMELLERMVRLSKTCSMFVSQSALKAGYSCSRQQSAREVLEFVTSHDGRFALRMALRQYIADGCLVLCTQLDGVVQGKRLSLEHENAYRGALVRARLNFRVWNNLYRSLELPALSSAVALARLLPALTWWTVAVGCRGVLHVLLILFSWMLDILAMPFRAISTVIGRAFAGFVVRTLDTPIDFEYDTGID